MVSSSPWPSTTQAYSVTVRAVQYTKTDSYHVAQLNARVVHKLFHKKMIVRREEGPALDLLS